jgi:threonine aldolase
VRVVQWRGGNQSRQARSPSRELRARGRSRYIQSQAGRTASEGAAMDERDFELRRNCTRFLSHHRPGDAGGALQRLARHPLAERLPDYYGSGGAVAELERRVIGLLGKDVGSFFAKGIIAQQCLLRVRSEQRTSPYVALSPMSHIDFDEANGVEHLHGLRPIRLGRYAPFSLKDLQGVTERLAAVVVELPLRRAAYRLPSWEELQAMSAWCRAQGVPLHFDGARLWEAAAGYGRPLAEVAVLADSVYVSFYKGIGGLAGCVLAGTRETIEATRVWRSRHGGSLFTAYPYALSALDGLDRQLPRMAGYVARARQLAARIRADGVGSVNPLIPDTNGFQLVLAGAVDELQDRHRRFAEREKIWLFNGFFESPFEGQAIAEIVIGDAADDYGDAEACTWLRRFQAMD